MSNKKKAIVAYFVGKNITTEDSDPARELYNRSRYGEIKSGKVLLSFYEALYLFENEKIMILDGKKKEISHDNFLRRARIIDDFLIKYAVFKDLRSRGYIVKTALKFGAEFRVYDKGVKPGQDHAKWIVFPVHESDKQTWRDFSAKNRVAHSTKKRLLIAVVDDEHDVSYWEANWLRP